jgi:hypothetical protein
VTPFITTFTGRKVNPLDLRPDDISIKDIAHHLSCINRFVGALREPVSVGQHSVFVYRLLKAKYPRLGLFHDAPEAYLGDVSKWVKHHEGMEGYRHYENKAWSVIADVFEVERGEDADRELEIADRLMVRFEASRGFSVCHMFDIPKYERPTEEEIALVGRWRPWSWRESEEAFMHAWQEIQRAAYASRANN